MDVEIQVDNSKSLPVYPFMSWPSFEVSLLLSQHEREPGSTARVEIQGLKTCAPMAAMDDRNNFDGKLVQHQRDNKMSD